MMCYEKHGQIYTMGVPGIGHGIKQLFVICCDPREYTKVIHNEGRNPWGAFINHWPPRTAQTNLNSTAVGLWTQGEEWRRLRMASQKALLTPDSVKGYIPGICKASAMSSENFDKWQDSVDIFNVYSSYDMLFTAMFGQLLNSLRDASDNNTAQFTKGAIEYFHEVLALMMSPYQSIMNSLGISTSRIKKFTELTRAQNEISSRAVDDFLARRERGELDEFELGSYVSVNLGMQEQLEDGLTLEEFKSMFTVFLGAGVDTTGTTLTWVLLLLALYPEVQTKVRQEVLSHVTIEGSSGDLVKALTRPKKSFPYLNMVIREVHRIRPTFTAPISKAVEADIELGSYAVPKGTICQFDLYAIQNDPKIVEDSEKFIPERWSPEAVEARKNTSSEVLDHPLLRNSFSAGARMCPGHRVAQLEVITMVATLVRQWQFMIAPGQGISEYMDVKYFQAMTLQPNPMPKFIVEKLSC